MRIRAKQPILLLMILMMLITTGTKKIVADDDITDGSDDFQVQQNEDNSEENTDGSYEDITVLSGDETDDVHTDVTGVDITDHNNGEVTVISEDDPDVITDNIDGSQDTESINYPSQSWIEETDDVRVFAYAPEGVFPEGTVMHVSSVSVESAIEAAQEINDELEFVDAVAVDITFHYEEEEIQPQGEVSIRLVAKRPVEGDSHDAITVDDNGEAEIVADASAQVSSFNTDHFTVYGIIGTDSSTETPEQYDPEVVQYARKTYRFYNGDPTISIDNWSIFDTRTFRNGDMLELPDNPSGSTAYTFEGWFIKDGSGNLSIELINGDTVTIDPASLPSTDDGTVRDVTINVYAKYSTKHKITLYQDREKKVIYETIIAYQGETKTLPTPEEVERKETVVAADQKMVGWTYPDQTDVVTQVTIANADVELVPIFVHAHMVKFNLVKSAFDDIAIPDQHVQDNSCVIKPSYIENNVYRGYRFKGWYTSNTFEESKKFDFLQALVYESPLSITLYAKWEPETVHFTVEVYQENAHANDEQFKVSESDSVVWNLDRTDLIDFILTEYKKTTYGGTGFHYSGSGIMNSDERPFIEIVNGSNVVTYDYNGNLVSGDAHNARVIYDGSTEVHVYYCRNIYKINFLFSNKGQLPNGKWPVSSNDYYYFPDGNKTKVSRTLKDGKAYAPSGYADTVLPIINAKHGEYLYECTHVTNTQYSAMFDAFMAHPNWYFDRQDFNGSGETVFNESNMTSPVVPVDDNAKDGDNLYVLIYWTSGEKLYKAKALYYDDVYTVDQIRSGIASHVKETHVLNTYYMPKGDYGHGHTYTINSASDGYRLVYVSNYYKVKLAGSTGVVDEQSSLPDGTHTFYWKNGRGDQGPIGDGETIYLHYVPATYTITFKQTKHSGKVNGHFISTGTRENDVVIENVLYGQDITEIINNNEPKTQNWTTIKDDNNNTYTSQANVWYGDTENGALPTKMPAKNLVFYKEWTGNTYTVVFDLNGHKVDGQEIHVYRDISYHGTIPNPQARGFTERTGYLFGGWTPYKAKINSDGSIEPTGNPITTFSINKPIDDNYYLVAEWHKNATFKVLYDPGDHGTINRGTIVDDPQTYNYIAKAPIKYIPNAEPGYLFIGWAIGGVTGSGTTLYGSGDMIEYSAENDALGAKTEEEKTDDTILLVAQYDPLELTTTVKYHSNYPLSNTEKTFVTEIQDVNAVFEVKSPTDDSLKFGTTYIADNGCEFEFVKWTNKEGEKVFTTYSNNREYFSSGDKVAAGQPDNAVNPGTNDLYAVWRVVNKYITINVEKEWSDDEDKDSIRPEVITFRFVIDGVEVPEDIEIREIDGKWECTFEGQPKYNTNTGELLNYSVKEVNVPRNYKVTVNSEQAETETDLMITNTHVPGRTEVSVTKEWNDKNDKDGIRPKEVRVQLLADGDVIPDMEPIVLNKENNWTYTWKDLIKNTGDEAVKYSVRELDEDGNLIEEGKTLIIKDYDKSYTVSYEQSGSSWTITNTHKVKSDRKGGYELPKTGIE